MDEDTSASTAVADSSVDIAPAEGTTEAVDTSTANDSDSTEPVASNDGQPDVPPQTPDTDVPDHGVDPDKGIDPDQGDEGTVSENETKGMTRAERAAYYGEVERQQRQALEQVYEEAYQPQSFEQLTQEFIDQGYDEFQAEIKAERVIAQQEKQISQATNQVIQLNANLQVDAVEARAKYEWMNPESKTFDRETTEIAAQMFEIATVKDERTGQIVDAKLSPSQVAGIVDKIRTSAMKEAGLTAQKNAERQMAAVAPQSSVTNKRDASFAELSPEQMREQLLAKGHVF